MAVSARFPARDGAQGEGALTASKKPELTFGQTGNINAPYDSFSHF
jgi:hypothetical protein